METKINLKFPWVLYDGCNSIVHLILITIYLPWFIEKGWGSNATNNNLLNWTSIVLVSSFLVAIFVILSASYIDSHKVRHRLFLTLNIIIALCAFLISLSFLSFNSWLPVICIVILISFNICLYIYDSYLIDAVHHNSFKETVTLSGIGWSLGYFVSGIFLFIIWASYDESNIIKTSSITNVTSWVALLFSVSAIFLLALWKQKTDYIFEGKKKIGFFDLFKNNSLINNDVRYFLIFAFFIQDGLVTLTHVVTLISKEALDFNLHQTIGFFLLVHLSGFISTIFLGPITSFLGTRKLYGTIIFLWLTSCIIMFILINANIFENAIYLLSLLIGLIIGTTPSILRATYSKIIPIENRVSFFGYGAIIQRSFSFFGPLLVVIVLKFSENNYQYIPMVIGIMFLIPLLMFFLNSNIKKITSMNE